MLNDINFEKSWESLRCKFQLKQITKSGEKMSQPMKPEFWEKFQKPTFKLMQNNILEQPKVNQFRQIRFSTQ